MARPKMNDATIVDTAYIVVPKTRERGRIQIISYIKAVIPEIPNNIKSNFLFMK
jgi:hypothetical protein